MNVTNCIDQGSFDVTAQNRVRQIRDRGHYDRETVFGILDRGLVAHVAFVENDRPVVIPMAYGRSGDRIFIHGAKKSRIARTMDTMPVSIGVTLVDGLVVGRSIFESSMNYRAVVIHGRAQAIEDPAELLAALRCVSEHNLPGRWDEVRAPLASELGQTGVRSILKRLPPRYAMGLRSTTMSIPATEPGLALFQSRSASVVRFETRLFPQMFRNLPHCLASTRDDDLQILMALTLGHSLGVTTERL
jgi:uncharacterized protein